MFVLCLTDPCPLWFDVFSILAGTDLNDLDQEKMTLWEEQLRKYFPERYGFEPFGDPLEDHPEGKAAHERRQDRILHARHKRQQALQGGGEKSGEKSEESGEGGEDGEDGEGGGRNEL